MSDASPWHWSLMILIVAAPRSKLVRYGCPSKARASHVVFVCLCMWVCLKMVSTPKNPMVLLIIIPMKNDYFIGDIPHFQTYPCLYCFWECHTKFLANLRPCPNGERHLWQWLSKLTQKRDRWHTERHSVPLLLPKELQKASKPWWLRLATLEASVCQKLCHPSRALRSWLSFSASARA